MIYTVECGFTDPTTETEWNAFYSHEKLPALVAVSGFHSSQRFNALTPGCPPYLALHSIVDLGVLQSDEYHRNGGGGFARWQRHITDWHRNLYQGLDRAPAIGRHDYLVVTETGPGSLLAIGLVPWSLQAVALDQSPEHRWLARLEHPTAATVQSLAPDLHLYAAMTPQLTATSVANP